MGDRETADGSPERPDHDRAAEAFVSRTRSRFGDEIESITVFGSTARREAATVASDVDVFVVLADDADSERVSDELRDVAYDVMLDYGPVVELHLVTRSEFESLRERGNPFVRNVVSEGRTYG